MSLHSGGGDSRHLADAIVFADLAQDLLEDVVSPEEAEDMERCFVVDSDSEEDGGKAEQCVLDPGDTMILIDEDDEAEEQRQQLERES